ncbi:MAG: hypothetical protein WCB18_07325 [Thermoplasmata archaeon]
MSLRHLHGDVGLLRETVSLLREFGLHSAERLAQVAEFLEKSVYAPRSLHAVPGGVGFTLLNPPLRVGAFSSIRVAWDGELLPPERVFVRTEGHAVERPLSDIVLARPIELRPGQRIEFRLDGVPEDSAHHRVRLELQNIAVPPLVWFEFSDPISAQPRA